MRKVVLKMNELFKFEVIKKLIDSNGNKKNAALKLNCTTRTINRLILKYKNEGKAGFIHKNRDRIPSSTFPASIKNKVIDLYLSTYSGSNLAHFSELLFKHEGIKISDTTINHWLRELDILSPKAKRKTIRRLNTELKNRKNASASLKEKASIEHKLELLERSNAHPRRPRCAYMGELVQMDASPHLWFGNSISHLHLAIDDATGKILGAFFDSQETLYAYYQVTRQILTTYGITAKFLTDRRSIFEYKRKNVSSDDKDTFTQFSYACSQLGIELECTSVPQAKGRVERLNQTLQSRLVVELRLAGISSIEDANVFLTQYIKEYNDRFSMPIHRTKHVFEKQLSDQKINQTLSILSYRKLDNGHCIRYQNKYYIPIMENAQKAYIQKGMTAMVIQTLDGSLYANILDSLFALKEVPVRETKSKTFDLDVQEKKQKKVYIPPMSHPWKHASFQAYLMKQKHRNSGANV